MIRRLLLIAVFLLLAQPGWADTPESIPNFCGVTGDYTTKDGAWSDPAVWSRLTVPGLGAQVRVTHAVTYDRMATERLDCLQVAGAGVLRFAPSSRLIVGTLLAKDGGLVEVGTAEAPIAAEIVIDGLLDPGTTTAEGIEPGSDPNTAGLGLLAVTTGRVTIHGLPVTPFVRLASEAAAGTTALALATAPQGWKAGDELVIPDTRHVKTWTGFKSQVEYRKIQAVAGTIVTLDSPLLYAHKGARDPDGRLAFLPHVANLSRSVTIRSANPTGARGHVLFRDRAVVSVKYARFQDLGRTRADIPVSNTAYDPDSGHVTKLGANQNGRYPFHFHRLDGPPAGSPLPSGWQAEAEGNVVLGGPRWGLVDHDSSYVLVKGNVIAGVVGAGIVIEEGTEVGSLVEGNFVVDSQGPPISVKEAIDPPEFARRGHGIWTQSYGVRFVNNVVTSVKDRGFFLNRSGPGSASQGSFTVYVPRWQGADTTDPAQVMGVRSRGQPIAEFAGNEVYGATGAAIETWRQNHNQPLTVDNPNALRDFTVWHTTSGLNLVTSTAILIDGLTVRGDPAVGAGAGISFNATYNIRFAVRKADIRGMAVGTQLPMVLLPFFEDSVLQNRVNVQVHFQRSGGPNAVPPNNWVRKALFRRTTFLACPSCVGTPKGNIEMVSKDLGGVVALDRDDVVIEGYNWQGIAGGDRRVYFAEQAPGYLWSVTGLTNATAASQHGVSLLDGLIPDTCAAQPEVLKGRLCPLAPRSPTVLQRSKRTATGAAYTLLYDAIDRNGVSHRGSKAVTLVAGKNWIPVTITLPTGETRTWAGLVTYTPK